MGNPFFGGESSGKFVNGVLGAVYREMSPSPGSEKNKNEDLVGAVVYKKNGELLFAFVHDVFGYWTLSKGHLKEKETKEEAVKREIKEEMDVDISPEEELGANEYTASDPERGKIKKRVVYFLASTKDKNLKLKETGGLDNVKWFGIKDLPDLKLYDDIRPIVLKAIKILKQKINGQK